MTVSRSIHISTNKTDFYSINVSDMSKTSVNTSEVGHAYKTVSTNGAKVEIKCDKCGDIRKGNVPSDYILYWETEGSDLYWSA